LYYSTKKQFEHGFKSIFYNKRAISCIPPKAYGDRFSNFMKKIFDNEDEIGEGGGSSSDKFAI
jgi:hypothetical protein